MDNASPASVMNPGDLDLSTDVRWLVQVSRAFASTPAARPERDRATAP
ncbi:hypothetical protein [Streptomyces sp. NPDC002602]